MRNFQNSSFVANFPNSKGPGPSPKVLKKTLNSDIIKCLHRVKYSCNDTTNQSMEVVIG